MAELAFSTNLIRLTEAMLTTVKCCVKIQNYCSEDPFETWHELRQGDVLSTLLFNVVLEAIVRQAKFQTTGVNFDKQTQLLAYSNDLDNIAAGV
jgi:hypothetical protein